MLFRVKILYDLIFSFKKPAVVLNVVCTLFGLNVPGGFLYVLGVYT